MKYPRDSIEIGHIRYFVAASEHGSFRQAAAALGVNESVISRRIRDLEDEVGASLFTRQSKGVQLTLAGQRFLDHSKEALKQIGAGREAVSAIGRGEAGQISVGLSSPVSRFLSDLIRTFGAGHEGVRITFTECDIEMQIIAVRRLRLDVAFALNVTQWPGCDAARLWSERLFLALPVNHSLSEKSELCWSDLVGEALLISKIGQGYSLRNFLAQREVEIGGSLEVQEHELNPQSLLPLVALGLGVTLVCETRATASFPGLVFRPIAGESIAFSAVWSPQNDNPALRRLLSTARTLSNGAAS